MRRTFAFPEYRKGAYSLPREAHPVSAASAATATASFTWISAPSVCGLTVENGRSAPEQQGAAAALGCWHRCLMSWGAFEISPDHADIRSTAQEGDREVDRNCQRQKTPQSQNLLEQRRLRHQPWRCIWQ